MHMIILIFDYISGFDNKRQNLYSESIYKKATE